MSGVDTVLPRGDRLERDERGHGLIRGSCGTDREKVSEAIPKAIANPTKRAGEGVQVGESSTHRRLPRRVEKASQNRLRRDPHYSENHLFCKGFACVFVSKHAVSK